MPAFAAPFQQHQPYRRRTPSSQSELPQESVVDESLLIDCRRSHHLDRNNAQEFQ